MSIPKNSQKLPIKIYEDQEFGLEIRIDEQGETLWLSQSQIAELFGKNRSVINKHIKNIYLEEELMEKSTCANFTQVQTEGARKVKRSIPHYNLDVVLSVGYRVNSKKATRFRQWANSILKDYLLKGYNIPSIEDLQSYPWGHTSFSIEDPDQNKLKFFTQ